MPIPKIWEWVFFVRKKRLFLSGKTRKNNTHFFVKNILQTSRMQIKLINMTKNKRYCNPLITIGTVWRKFFPYIF